MIMIRRPAKTADDYQNINRLSTHGNLMIIITRSAKTEDDHQNITRIFTDINKTI